MLSGHRHREPINSGSQRHYSDMASPARAGPGAKAQRLLQVVVLLGTFTGVISPAGQLCISIMHDIWLAIFPDIRCWESGITQS